MQQPAGLEAQEGARVARAIALATKMVCDEESNGDSNEGNDDKGGGRAMAAMAMATQ
jgi:hypothetical protein